MTVTPARFAPTEDRALAHGVHLLALADGSHAVTPGYARNDARLRASIKARPPALDPTSLPSFADLLAGAAPPDLDVAWFDRRWDTVGERESATREAARVAREADETPLGALLGGWTVQLAVATGLRAGAWPRPFDPESRVGAVATGPGTPGALAALAAVGARLPLDERVAALLPEDRDQVRLHCAGSVLALELGDGPEMTTLLEAVADALLPPQHQGRRVVEMIERVRAAGLLDQPPGEIERLAQGMARRYPDRLHRAWLRGFFVPRGQDARSWLASLRSGAAPHG